MSSCGRNVAAEWSMWKVVACSWADRRRPPWNTKIKYLSIRLDGFSSRSSRDQSSQGKYVQTFRGKGLRGDCQQSHDSPCVKRRMSTGLTRSHFQDGGCRRGKKTVDK